MERSGPKSVSSSNLPREAESFSPHGVARAGRITDQHDSAAVGMLDPVIGADERGKRARTVLAFDVFRGSATANSIRR